MDTNWDVIVVGAGAAGLLAGISAGKSGAKTLVLEKNRKPGVKILMSGGTRCNITHNTDNRGIVKAFGNKTVVKLTPSASLNDAKSAYGAQAANQSAQMNRPMPAGGSGYSAEAAAAARAGASGEGGAAP